MRSLTLLTAHSSVVRGKKPSSSYTSLAVRSEGGSPYDPASTLLYLASERQLPDGGVDIQVINATSEEVVAAFQAPPEPPFQLPRNGKHVVSFKFLAETANLVLVLAGGDIVVIALEDSLPGHDQVEVVGSVEAGIKAAEWSPDEELLVLVTGEDKLVEMTKTFDVLAESPLRTEEFGEDKPVNVGWGAQTTQFHGSIGKAGREAVAGLPAASRLSAPGASSSQSGPLVEQDDGSISISWRGDGAFFVISTLFNTAKGDGQERRLRFYSRTAVLQSTSEPTPGLEGSLAWQPSGSIIASSAGNADQIVFFERNGLRRYEFSLKERKEWSSQVRRLEWNSDSTVLAVWLERLAMSPDDARRTEIQLWRRNNYHWYLKQTTQPMIGSDEQGLTAVQWHTENALQLYMLSASGFESRLFVWDTYASPRTIPDDSGAVAVVDGPKVLFTPFKYQNVPPPMSSMVFDDEFGQTPVHIVFSEDADVFATLMVDGTVNLWSWTFGKGNRCSKNHLGRVRAVDEGNKAGLLPRQLVLYGDKLAVLFSGTDGKEDFLSVSTLIIRDSQAQLGEISTSPLMSSVIRVSAVEGQLFLQDSNHTILDQSESPIASFPESCPYMQAITTTLFLGLSESGRLYANERVLATGVSSFATGGDFLIYTTISHDARFVLLKAVINEREAGLLSDDHLFSQSLRQKANQPQDPAGKGKDTSYNRRVERGSRIVTVSPSSMTVVLQMPRGNLETISPRPLVLQAVRRHIQQSQYREAFLICRRHRIDLNFLCDWDLLKFKKDLGLFVDQIGDGEYLNLFISGLKNQDVTQTLYSALSPERPASASTSSSNKVHDICTRLRACLESKDLIAYANSILTTYVCLQPPDLESALSVITKLKSRDAEAAEDAVKYVIFLADANKLYDVALGMYDFELVLAVAQNSQKDPREYIPFLRELRTFETYMQRHKIDDHLKRYRKALFNLAQSGDDNFEDVLTYMERYELYDDAVRDYRSKPDKLKVILDLRGDWLMKDDRAHEAALSYTLADQPRKAMIAHQRALTWLELFDIAVQQQLSSNEIKELAESVAAALKSKGRHGEAGRILLEYGQDVSAAVETLCEGTDYAEALRIASLRSMPDLVSGIIVPSMLDTKERLCDEAEELKEQVQKQAHRLGELREKRINESESFYGKLMPSQGDDALDNVDVQTEGGASTVATTQFTRYTKAGLSSRGSVKSGFTTKTRRKQIKKATTGAKGSIYEESYLLGSLTKIVAPEGKLAQLVRATASLNRILLRLSASPSVVSQLDSDSESLPALAAALEDAVASAVAFVEETIGKVWDALGDAEVLDLDAALLAEADPEKADEVQDVLRRPERPQMPKLGHWRVGLLQLLEG